MPLSEQDVERLHQRRYRSFRHGAAAIVGDYERAHDVVQEAFARALAARGDFRGGSAEAWLWTIVKRQAFDARREGELPWHPDDRLFFSSPSFAGPGTERVLVGLRGPLGRGGYFASTLACDLARRRCVRGRPLTARRWSALVENPSRP